MAIGKDFITSTNCLDEFTHGGNVAQEANRLGIKANKLLDASASLVPFSYPKEINKCIIKTLKSIDLKSYPDRNLEKLKTSISNWHKIDPSMILPGNGAAELITWAAKDAKKNGLSILPIPSFSDYQRALKCWDAPYEARLIPLTWQSSFPQSFPIKSTSNVVWITNPHNPTGQLWSKDSLTAIIKSNKLVICDEAFLPLVPNGEKESVIPLVKNYPNLIVIRSLTKLFSIAGLRLGYAISSSERINDWQTCRDPWPMNALAIAVGVMLMTHPKLLTKQTKKVQKWVAKEGAWLHSKLKALNGIQAHPSSTNFQLIESSQPLTRICKNLAQEQILLRDCRSFQGLGANWLRISLQKRSGNLMILDALQKFLD